jgi:predicted transcriptional regulator
MAEVRKLDLNDPAPLLEDEDEETLAELDRRIREADAGTGVSIEEVRKRLREWTTASSSRKKL